MKNYNKKLQHKRLSKVFEITSSLPQFMMIWDGLTPFLVDDKQLMTTFSQT
jgi:hypothetical protein